MKRILKAIFVTILTSLYIFPCETIWLPSINTKMALAAFAPIIFVINGARMRNAQISKRLFILSIFALFVSFMGLISVIINNTHDYSYATYFVSMWVWLGGAYVVIQIMNFMYGKVNIRMIGNFLVAVAVIQCILSQIIHTNEVFANFVDSFMISTGFMGKPENRLYGIGCALDVAGIKFSTILIIIAFFSISRKFNGGKDHVQYIYMLAYIIVAILGSMIARTTSVGIILSILLWIILYFYYPNKSREHASIVRTIKTFCVFIIVLLPSVIYLYHANDDFYSNVRFGFEGFFSLVEKGKWEVQSNNQMLSMVVWPNNLKTWFIGDGYFENPMKDFYYLGPEYNYYLGTDVGYCRFIFYFGLLGLLVFSLFFIVSAYICSINNPQYAIMFWFFLFINFIVWVKVSSDIFPIFALFLCVAEFENEKCKLLQSSESEK